MIEVTCAACGSSQRFPDADSGKVSSCAKCKARITVPRTLPSIPSPGAGGGTGDIINLSDLPAPKRPSPLAGAPLGAKPPPMPPRRPGTPPPVPAAPLEMPSLDMDSIDLPAPVGPTGRGITDLPAPVGPTGRGITDLPAPVGPTGRGITDLPAPVGPTGRGITDLPAPVGPTGRGITDLPAPVGPTGRGITDLPTPVGPTGRGITDLPTPVGPTGRGITDLPTPVGPTGRGGAPRAASPGIRTGSLDPFGDPRPTTSLDDEIDLLAPRGQALSLDDSIDLPAPAPGGIDLPAPKGFFDDLPAPRGAEPKPASSVDLPAPKGFFDDLPAPRGATGAKPASVDLPAPKGFFDDLPGPRGAVPALAPTTPPVTPPAAKPRGMDLDDLDLAPPTQPPMPRVSPPPTGAAQARTAGPMPLDLGGDSDVPPLELDGPADKYGGLDLPLVPPAGTDPAKAQTLAAASGAGVSFKPSTGGGASDAATIHVPRPDSLDLDIDETKRPEKAGKRSGKTEAQAPAGDKGKAAAKAPMSPKKRRAVLLGVLAFVVIGGAGGVFMFKRWKHQQARTEQRDRNLADARRLLTAGTSKHWAGAASAAEAVLAIDGGNAEAMGIAVQAYVAGFLEEGTGEEGRRKAADRVVDLIHAKSARGIQVDKGLAIYGVINNDAAGSVERLSELAEGSKDPDISLFLGWAQAERRQWDEAIEAFGGAADAKNRAVPATYNIGLAQLAKGDVAGAKASFSTVNDLSNHAHLGAQVGIQAAMPASEYARRESELLSILNLKEIAKADPRVVAWAWALAGDDARRAGRLDAARDRYAKALELQPELLSAIVGTAEIALHDNRLPAAGEAIDKALEIAPEDPDANLAAVDRYIRMDQPSDAETALIKLRAMTMATTEQKVRLHMLDGMHLEKIGQGDKAVEAYAAAQAAADPGDIAPAVAQASLLGRLAAEARAKTPPDTAAADAYAARSETLLADLEAKAKDDPVSELALGRAFLAAGNAAKAEVYLAKALKARPDDIEANFQLVEALRMQGKVAEAAKAAMIAFQLDPTRTELALSLAATLEEAGRTEDATKIYEQLLLDPAVTLNTRVRAGMFFTRARQFEQAGTQGDAIVKAEPKNAAGLYLQGEAAYAKSAWEDASKLFKDANANDPSSAVYAEALARAYWQLALKNNNDPQYYDKALIAYEDAAAADPKMLSAQLGRGELHLRRNEWQPALEAYQAALTLAPNDPKIPLGIGTAYHELKQYPQALEWLNKSVKLKPTAEAYYRIGRLYDSQDAAAKAGKAFAQATTMAMQDERSSGTTIPGWFLDAAWKQGTLLETAGDEKGACQGYQRFLDHDPTDPTLVMQAKTHKLGLHC